MHICFSSTDDRRDIWKKFDRDLGAGVQLWYEQSLNANSNSVQDMFRVYSNSVHIQILFRVWAYPVQSLRKAANFVPIQFKFHLETRCDIRLCANIVQYRYRPWVMNMSRLMFVQTIKLCSCIVLLQTSC